MIDLTTLDEFLLAKIVKKFNTIRTGGRFYRSCRAARDLVELVKPAWPNADLHLYYADLKCSDDLFETVFIPDVMAIGVVEIIALGFTVGEKPLSEEQVQQLLTAANPEAVGFVGNHYDVYSPTFKNIKNLHFSSMKKEEMSFWETNRVFELMPRRKTITWYYNNEAYGMRRDENFGFPIKAIATFLEKLMKSCIREPEGYILEREAAGQLRICIDRQEIKIPDCDAWTFVFHFS